MRFVDIIQNTDYAALGSALRLARELPKTLAAFETSEMVISGSPHGLLGSISVEN